MEESSAPSNGDAVETTMELPFLAPAEITKHRLHPGLGQKAQVLYSPAFSTSEETVLQQPNRREVMAGFQATEDTTSMCTMISFGLWEGRLSPGSQGSGSETLVPLSPETTKGFVEKKQQALI